MKDVSQTLENMINAGIKVWMLTGDKIETAICIAISSGMMIRGQRAFLIREVYDETKLQLLLNQYEAKSESQLVVVDGVSLATILSMKEELFFQIAMKASCVVCCRCSPNQKASVTECIIKYSG